MNPLTAKITIQQAASGLWAATVDNGYTSRPLVGYITRAEAEAGAERFCVTRLGRRAIWAEPPAERPAGRPAKRRAAGAADLERRAEAIKRRRAESARRSERRAARAAKESTLRYC